MNSFFKRVWTAARPVASDASSITFFMLVTLFTYTGVAFWYNQSVASGGSAAFDMAQICGTLGGLIFVGNLVGGKRERAVIGRINLTARMLIIATAAFIILGLYSPVIVGEKALDDPSPIFTIVVTVALIIGATALAFSLAMLLTLVGTLGMVADGDPEEA